MLARGDLSKLEAAKILNILGNLSEVKHLILRDFAIYKTQSVKPASQPVTALVCQTFLADKQHTSIDQRPRYLTSSVHQQ